MLTEAFQDHEVRALTLDTDPYVVANDVCDVLEYNDTSVAVRGQFETDSDGEEYRSGGIYDDEWTKTNIEIPNPGSVPGTRMEEMLVVNEPGVYHLVFNSRSEAAKEFKRWVFHDLLPELRRTGFYSTNENGQAEADLDGLGKFHMDPSTVKIRRITHYLTEDDIYTRFEHMVDALGYVKRRFPQWLPGRVHTAAELGIGNPLNEHEQSQRWISYETLIEWLDTCSKENAGLMLRDYVGNLLRYAYQARSEEAETQDALPSGVEDVLDRRLEDLKDSLTESVNGTESSSENGSAGPTPDCFGWSEEDLRGEIKGLVGRDLNNWTRIYDQYNRLHGTDLRKKYSGSDSSVLQSAGHTELAYLLSVAMNLLA